MMGARTDFETIQDLRRNITAQERDFRARMDKALAVNEARLDEIADLRAKLRECETFLRLTMAGDAAQNTPQRQALVNEIVALLERTNCPLPDTAKAVDAVVVSRLPQAYVGVTYLVVKMDGTDYADYKRLPKVLEFEGRLFGATGWNSDRGEAYYADNVTIAKAHRRR